MSKGRGWEQGDYTMNKVQGQEQEDWDGSKGTKLGAGGADQEQADYSRSQEQDD
jgi:hypothetical protein